MGSTTNRFDPVRVIFVIVKDDSILPSNPKYSPIDAYVAPIPSYMAGYEDDIIMAAGTFVKGASIELSADGPLREPYSLLLTGWF